ncbi:MAG: hypothetical protein PHW13_07340 [Methylococcales bacterium]|nr:hypothetical protein [Methylococcales bacterium]
MTNPKPPLGNIQNAMELGEIVANQRKAQGLTQAELAGLAQTGTLEKQKVSISDFRLNG